MKHRNDNEIIVNSFGDSTNFSASLCNIYTGKEIQEYELTESEFKQFIFDVLCNNDVCGLYNAYENNWNEDSSESSSESENASEG